MRGCLENSPDSRRQRTADAGASEGRESGVCEGNNIGKENSGAGRRIAGREARDVPQMRFKKDSAVGMIRLKNK